MSVSHIVIRRPIEVSVLILPNRPAFVEENMQLVREDAHQKVPVRHFVQIPIISRSVPVSCSQAVEHLPGQVVAVVPPHVPPIVSKIHKIVVIKGKVESPLVHTTRRICVTEPPTVPG